MIDEYISYEFYFNLFISIIVCQQYSPFPYKTLTHIPHPYPHSFPTRPHFIQPVISHKNYLVHDETAKCVLGDVVELHPLIERASRRKTHMVGAIVVPASRYTDPDTGIVYSQQQWGSGAGGKVKERKG